ncbi:MAG: hypothetical protein PHQ72_12390 [Hespellia sp.]|nr:hypothetical protein [Hespellia sp.]
MEKVYIAMVNTPGIFATMIRKYLKIPYVHVVLGLDADLSEAYSVGRRFVNIPVIAGFERENLNKIEKKYPDADYKIMSVACTRKQKLTIEKELAETFEVRYQMHYAILGLLFLVLKKPFYQEGHYTCSSYIARLLSEHGVLNMKKHFSLVTPKDFYELENLDVVFEGKIGELVRSDEEEYHERTAIYSTGMRHLLGTVSGQ